MDSKYLNKHLPLTESTAYIMLALKVPLHGYGVMKQVEELSESTVTIGAGTLYGNISTLESRGFIIMTAEEGRRKIYVLTSDGLEVLTEHLRRTAILVNSGKETL